MQGGRRPPPTDGASLAPKIITVFRTDADPRTVDLSIDPSERPYGSLFGKRPDLIDYGQVGFGRLTTPEAWLSTWSGLSSNAEFVRCAPGVTVPTLFVELTGDQAAFPADSRRMIAALGAADLTTAAVRGLHFGGAIADGEPTGNELAAHEIAAWLGARYAAVGCALPNKASSADQLGDEPSLHRARRSGGRRRSARSAGGASAGGRPAPGGSVWCGLRWWWS